MAACGDELKIGDEKKPARVAGVEETLDLRIGELLMSFPDMEILLSKQRTFQRI